MKSLRYVLFPLAMMGLLLAGCGPREPITYTFEKGTYRYLNHETVEVTVDGVTHTYSPDTSPEFVPYAFRFEDDGEINIWIDGEMFDLDSPYDVEFEKVKLSKKSAKKIQSVNKFKPAKKKVKLTKRNTKPTKKGVKLIKIKTSPAKKKRR